MENLAVLIGEAGQSVDEPLSDESVVDDQNTKQEVDQQAVADSWLLVGASVRGHAHEANGLPCQDYSLLERFGAFGLAIVCDGAGSAEHADAGAKQTALSCRHHLLNLLRETRWDHQPELPDPVRWHDEAKAMLQNVRDDLDRYSGGEDWPLKSLASTVIAVVFTDHWLLLTHIGDGRAGVCRADGTWEAMLTPFHGEEANETVFVTSDIWTAGLPDRYIESRVVAGPLRAFCLLTDGAEKASFECNLYDADQKRYYDPNRPFPPFFDPVIGQLQKLYGAGRSRAEVDALWANFLTNGNARFQTEPDDRTLLVGVRKP